MASRTASVLFLGDDKALNSTLARIESKLQSLEKQAATSNDKMAASSEKAQQRIGASHQKIAGSFDNMVKSAAKAAVGFGAAYLAIGGVKSSVDAVQNLTEATLTLHHATGLSVQTASSYAAVANVNNIANNTLARTFGTLAKNVTAATNVHDGLSKSAKTAGTAFAELGISSQQLVALHGNMDAIMRLVVSRFEQMPGSATKAAAGMALFGRGWQTLMPLMHPGALGLDAQRQAAEKMGATLGGHTVQSLIQLKQAQENAKYATLGLQLAFGQYLAPVLTKMLTAFGTFINQMRTGTGAGGELKNALQGIGSVLGPIAHFFEQQPSLIAAAIGGWAAWRAAAIAAMIATKAQAVATAVGIDTALGSTGVGLILVGVGTGATLMATHWQQSMDMMKQVTQDAVNNGILPALNFVINRINDVIDAYNKLFGWLTGNIGKIKDLANISLGGQDTMGGTVGPLGTTTTIQTHGSNAQQTAQFLQQSLHLSPVAIAGILGNLNVEAPGINPNEPGGGIAQWIGGRQQGLQYFAKAHGTSPTDLKTQLSYMIAELEGQKLYGVSTNFSNVLAELRKAKTPEEAARIFSQQYEKPGIPHLDRRQSDARRFYQQLTSHAGGGVPSAGSPAQLLAGYGVNTAAALGVPVAVTTMLSTAQALVGTRYSYGGGHGGWDPIAALKKIGVDCTGFVSRVLHSGGVLSTPQDTVSLPHAGGIARGQGRFVTVWDRPQPGQRGHALIDILGKWFESGGSSQFNPSGGVSQLTAKQAAGELALGGFQAFHPTTLNQLVRGGKSVSGSALGGASLMAQAIQSATQALTKSANTLAQRYTDAAGKGQGPIGRLEALLGVSPKFAASENVTASPEAMAQAQARVAGSTQERGYNQLIANLHRQGLNALVKQVVQAHHDAMVALALQLQARDISAQAARLNVDVAETHAQTQAAQDAAQARIQIARDESQRTVNAIEAQTKQIEDMTQSIKDAFQAAAQSITDQSAIAHDASQAAVQAMQDQTQIRVDTLAERGLFGLNLKAQQEQVALDLLKAQYDKQIAIQQQNVEQVKAQWNTKMAIDQQTADQVQQGGDRRIAEAQANLDAAQIGEDIHLAASQAKFDSINNAQQVRSALGDLAVALSTDASQSQQAVANALKQHIDARAHQLTEQAQKELNDAVATSGAATQAAQSNLAQVQAGVAAANAQAQQILAIAQGQASTAVATAEGALQSVQDQATQAEQQMQDEINVLREQAQTQFAGTGTIVNIYGLPAGNAAAVADAVDWVARTQLNVPA